jgi:acetyl-CoA synthetase
MPFFSQIGAVAAPDKSTGHLDFLKSSVAKIMQRILCIIAAQQQLDELGCISTLADPGVIDQLVALSDCYV